MPARGSACLGLGMKRDPEERHSNQVSQDLWGRSKAWGGQQRGQESLKATRPIMG